MMVYHHNMTSHPIKTEFLRDGGLEKFRNITFSESMHNTGHMLKLKLKKPFRCSAKRLQEPQASPVTTDGTLHSKPQIAAS